MIKTECWARLNPSYSAAGVCITTTTIIAVTGLLYTNVYMRVPAMKLNYNYKETRAFKCSDCSNFDLHRFCELSWTFRKFDVSDSPETNANVLELSKCGANPVSEFFGEFQIWLSPEKFSGIVSAFNRTQPHVCMCVCEGPRIGPQTGL